MILIVQSNSLESEEDITIHSTTIQELDQELQEMISKKIAQKMLRMLLQN